MTTLTALIVAVFVLGYFLIAIESLTKINKAAIALLMFVGCWTIFMFDPGQYLAAAIGGDWQDPLQSLEDGLASTRLAIAARDEGTRT